MIRCCGTGFNRYIVECKLIIYSHPITAYKRFNRYIVECKYIVRSDRAGGDKDLIDT